MSAQLPIISLDNLKADAAVRSTTIQASSRSGKCTGYNGTCAIVNYPSSREYCQHAAKIVRHCCGGKMSSTTGDPVFCAPYTLRLFVQDAAVDAACANCEEVERQRRLGPAVIEAQRRNAAHKAFVEANADALEVEQATLFADAAARYYWGRR